MTYITRSRGNASAKILGVGKSTAPINYGETTNLNGIGLWLKTSAASGDFRGIYARAYFNGATGGEAVRAYATTTATGVAAGGTVNGIHASLSMNASSSIAGQGFAGRFTLDAAADTRTLNPACASILIESNIATGNTVPAATALIRVAEIGAVAVKKLFKLPTVASAGLLAAHTTDAITHSIRCVDDAGTVFYIMATTTATNRTGGA
jgi:hypothetical protein